MKTNKAFNIHPEMLPKKAGDVSGGGADAPGGAVFPDVPEAVGVKQLDLSLPDVMARFPNVKAFNQDKSHASKRFTSRLWKCDDRAWEVYICE